MACASEIPSVAARTTSMNSDDQQTHTYKQQSRYNISCAVVHPRAASLQRVIY